MVSRHVKPLPRSLNEATTLSKAKEWFYEVTRNLSIAVTTRIKSNAISSSERATDQKIDAACRAWEKYNSFRVR